MSVLPEYMCMLCVCVCVCVCVCAYCVCVCVFMCMDGCVIAGFHTGFFACGWTKILSLGEIMCIAFEGPKHTLVDVDNILNVFKEDKIVVFYCTPI